MRIVKSILPLVGLVTLSATSPAFAEDDMLVKAEEPHTIVSAMKMAGYEVELTTDGVGDPLIKTEIYGWNVLVYFYGCDSITNDDCDSIQFSVGFDRAMPWSAEAAIEVSSRYRFAAIRLDDEGDPYVTWDVVTGDGISTGTFLKSVREFGANLDPISELVFADDENVEEAADLS